MTLQEMLEYIDFYAVADGSDIRLVDSQGANLGDIEDERWDLHKDSVPLIISRMEMYWNDYVYAGLVDPVVNKSGKPLDDYKDNGSYEELLVYCDEHGIQGEIVEVLRCIVHPETVSLDIEALTSKGDNDE